MNKQEVVQKLTTLEKDFNLFNGFYEFRALNSDLIQLKHELANRGFEFEGIYPTDSNNTATLDEVITVWATRTKNNLNLIPVSTANDIAIRNSCIDNVEELFKMVTIEGVEGGEESIKVEETNADETSSTEKVFDEPEVELTEPVVAPEPVVEPESEQDPAAEVAEAAETVEAPSEEPASETAEKTPSEEAPSEEKPKRRRKKSED